MRTWYQVREWVRSPLRTLAELQDACQSIGLDIDGEPNVLSGRLERYIEAQSQGNLAGQATWSPPGWTAPATPPQQPTPPQAAEPAAPRRGGGSNWVLLSLAGGLLMLAAGLLIGLGFNSSIVRQPGQPTATVTSQSNPSATATSVTASTATSVQTTGTAKFPTTPAEAAATFGGDVSRWEPTADPGGWHLREEPFSTVINPHGFLGEGYFDTKPGKNPQCFAFTIPMGVQGATVWSEAGTRANAEKLQTKMAIPVWDDKSQKPCQVMTQ